MLRFCAVFNCSNRADKEKDKSNYCFSSIVKNNGKEGLKLSKVRKMVTSNFQEKINRDKARKNKNKNQNNAFCLPLIGFFIQSSQYQIWKADTYSILTNGNRTCTGSMAVIHLNLKVLWPHGDSEHKFRKKKFENWLSTGFELKSPWLGTYSHKYYTMFNLQYCSMIKSLKLLYTHLQSLRTILKTLHIP